MKIKKVLAGTLALLTAGATLGVLSAAQSTTLGDYVATTDGTLTSPMIVVGGSPTAPVSGSDVVGAADIAASVAGYATTPAIVSGLGAQVTVSGGKGLNTPNQNLYLNDSINTVIQTLTASDLPSLLASDQVTVSSTVYEYDQFIDVGSSFIEFGTSDDDVDDPIYLIQLGTDKAVPAYTTKVVFNKALNFSHSNTHGETIELFGVEYTIGATSTNTKIVLQGAGETLVLEEAEEATIEIGGTVYTIKLVGISDENTAVVQVGDDIDNIDEGETETIGGLDIYAKGVFFIASETLPSSAQLQIGSAEVTLEHGQEVSMEIEGEDEDIENTNVTITGTGEVSSIEIAVAAQEDDTDHIEYIADDTDSGWFQDPIFGSFWLAFGGMTPVEGSDDFESIEFDTSGTDDAKVEFTDHRGERRSFVFAAGDDSANAIYLADSGNDTIYVYEGAEAIEDEYLMVDSGEFGHIFEITKIDAATANDEGEVTLRDVVSGSTISKTIPEGLANNANVDWIIDGQTYKLNVTYSGTETMILTWGAGASNGDVGSSITVFPLIQTSRGGWLAITDEVDVSSVPGFTDADTIEFPGDPKVTYDVPDDLYNAVGALIQPANMSSSVPQLTYNVTINTSGSSNTVVIGLADIDASNARFTDPAIVFVQEEDDDNEQHALIADVDWEGTNDEIEWNEPAFTNSLQFASDLESNDDLRKGVDEWGMIYIYDTGPDQPIAEAWYPDYQTFASVAIGSDPTFTVGGGAVEIETALKITNPVAKFVSEITATSALNHDIILVGGPCANSIVATLVADDNITCSNWETAEQFGPNTAADEGLIKEYLDAFDSGQKALVVAGTSAADTRALAHMVQQGTFDFDSRV